MGHVKLIHEPLVRYIAFATKATDIGCHESVCGRQGANKEHTEEAEEAEEGYHTMSFFGQGN
jgi:hypothetical protein